MRSRMLDPGSKLLECQAQWTALDPIFWDAVHGVDEDGSRGAELRELGNSEHAADRAPITVASGAADASVRHPFLEPLEPRRIVEWIDQAQVVVRGQWIGRTLRRPRSPETKHHAEGPLKNVRPLDPTGDVFEIYLGPLLKSR